MKKNENNKDSHYLEKYWSFWFIFLIVSAFAFRLWTLMTLPELAEASYEEGGAGLYSAHILKGEWITFEWGHTYIGASGFYLTALAYCFLPKNILILRLVSLIISMVGVIFSGLLAREIFGKKWSLFALLWWVTAPVYLTRFSLTPFCYINCVSYGCVLLYLAYLAFYKHPQKMKIWFFLGFFCGLVFWEHLVTICYLAAVGVWLIYHVWQKNISPKVFKFLIPGFLVGNFPFWFWNIRHAFETFTSMLTNKSVPCSEISGRIIYVFRDLLSELLGRGHLTFPFWHDPVFSKKLALAIYLLYAPILIFFLCKTLGWILRWKKEKNEKPEIRDNTRLLWLFFLFACGQVVMSDYWKGLYLMPVYSAVPLLFTHAAKEFSKKFRLFGFFMLLLLWGIHIADNYKMHEDDIPIRHNPRPVDSLIQFLNNQGINRVYAHYTTAWYLTFESREKIIASDYYGMTDHIYYQKPDTGIYMTPFFKYLHEVDMSDKIACISEETLFPLSSGLEKYFKFLGADYKKRVIGKYIVYFDFKHTHGDSFQPVSTEGAQIKSSILAADDEKITDGVMNSVWTSGIFQKAGLSLELTLPEIKKISRICITPGEHTLDFPRGLKVECSTDGKYWKPILEGAFGFGGMEWMGNHPRLNTLGEINLYFAPVEFKYLKFTLTKDSEYPWSIAELMLYEKSNTPPLPNPLKISDEMKHSLLTHLDKNKTEHIFSMGPWNAFFTNMPIKQFNTVSMHQPQKHFLKNDDHIIRFEKRNAFWLSSQESRLKPILNLHSIPYQEITLDQGSLILTESTPLRSRYYWHEGDLISFKDKDQAYKILEKAKEELNKKKYSEAEFLLKESNQLYLFFIESFDLLKQIYMETHQEEKLNRLNDEIQRLFVPEVKSSAVFDDHVQLIGLNQMTKNAVKGQPLEISYYWRSLSQVKPGDYYIFVHFEGESGEVFIQDHQGGNGVDPLSDWLPGEFIRETCEVTIPETYKSEHFKVYLGIWEPKTQRRWRVSQSNVQEKDRSILVKELQIH